MRALVSTHPLLLILPFLPAQPRDEAGCFLTLTRLFAHCYQGNHQIHQFCLVRVKLLPAKTSCWNFKRPLFQQIEKPHGWCFCNPKFTPKTAPAKAKVRRCVSSRIKQAWISNKYCSQSWLSETGWEITYLYFFPAKAEIFTLFMNL